MGVELLAEVWVTPSGSITTEMHLIIGGNFMMLHHGVPLEINLLLYMYSRILRSLLAIVRKGKKGLMTFKPSVGEL